MKRGLVLLDPTETPPSELRRRVDVLQGALGDANVDVALVYGDVHHSGDITYLSNICIYWNEGMLAIPRNGEAALLTKLSPRVHTWMRSTSSLKDLRSGPSLAALAKSFLGDREPGALGLVEMDWWPGLLVSQLAQGLAGWELRDLGPVVRRRRQRPTKSEQALLSAGASVTAAAVLAGSASGLSNEERAGKAEYTARAGGVEDASVHCHEAALGVDSVEVTSEYRGYWTTAARVVGASRPAWLEALQRAFVHLERSLRAGTTLAALEAQAREHFVGAPIQWEVDVLDHTDLETDGDYRTDEDRRRPVEEDMVVGLRLAGGPAGQAQAVVADTYLIGSTGASRLTGDLPGIAL